MLVVANVDRLARSVPATSSTSSPAGMRKSTESPRCPSHRAAGASCRPPEGYVQSSQPRFGRVDGAARLESGVDVEGLAPCADIVVAGGIGRVVDQRLELEGLRSEERRVG